MEEQAQSVGVMTDRVDEMTCNQCSCVIDVRELDPFVRIQCPKCHHEQPVPAKLGSFLLVDLIGAGGMGGVYCARDESLGRNVAIKVMLKSLGDDAKLVETFKREAQAVAQLNNPHIAQIYSFGQEKGQPYIVMELISGEHFDAMVEEEEPLDQALVLKIMLDIAEALQAADEVGLVHGDIKPENILLDDKMEAKLVDFGLATFVDQAAEEGIWGTPYYISPEKIRRKKTDARSDIYSLGATMYHALAGRPPFEGKTPIEVVRARLEGPPTPLHEVRPDINPQLESLVTRMLELETGKRHPNYRSLTGDMRKALDSLGGAPNSKAIRALRLRALKRSTTLQNATDGPLAGVDPSATVVRKKGKIVIRRGEASAAMAELQKSGPRAQAQSSERSETRKKGRRKTSTVFVIFGLIIIFGIVGSFAGIHFKKKHATRIARRIEALALGTAQTSLQNAYKSVQADAAAIRTLSEGVSASFQIITGALSFVEGSVPALSVEPPPLPTTEAPKQDTDGSEEGAVVSTEHDGDESVPEADTETPAVDTPAPLEPVIPNDEPNVVTWARNAVDALRTVNTLAASATRLEGECEALNEEVAKTTVSTEAMTLSERAQGMADQSSAMVQEARSAIEDAQRHIDRITELRDRTAKQREAETIRQQEAAARQAAEDELRRQREAAAQKIDQEVTRASGLWTDTLDTLKQGNYDDAIRTIRNQGDTFDTDEGKQAHQTLVERCEYLVKLRDFLVKELNEKPFKWGWIQNRSPEDVLGASTRGVRIRSGMVLWQDVTVRQMLNFLKHYLNDRAIPARKRADGFVAAAIFSDIHGGTEAAAIYANKAVELRPNLKTDIDRLIPLHTEEDGENNTF